MTNRSGPHRIDRIEIRRLLEEVNAPAPVQRPKVLPRFVEPIDTNHAKFLELYRTATSQGWTMRALARHLELKHHRPLIDWRDGNRPVSSHWIERMEAIVSGVETDHELPSSTGTDGP